MVGLVACTADDDADADDDALVIHSAIVKRAE